MKIIKSILKQIIEEELQGTLNEEKSISDKEIEELKTIKDELHAASKMHKSQAKRIESIIKGLVREELEAVLQEKPNFFDNMRKKKERCKGKPKTGDCAEDRPTKKQWKKITAEELTEAERLDKSKMPCNKPRRTPNHPTKSHVVKACEGGKEKIIRFGEQGASTAGKPKKGESHEMKMKRKKFKARHGKNIKKGKMSAAYWADKEKW